MELVTAIRGLYNKGLAAREVADKLGISVDRVYKLMRRKNIPRRTVVEANKLAYLRKPATFKPAFIENQEQKKLKLAGAMLYWAEGAKGGCFVDFANSDERMIKIFLRFLREVCGVCENKLRVYLYCYPQHDVDLLVDHWSEVTGILSEQFTRPYVRKKTDGITNNKLKYGLIHIRYNDKKLQMMLLELAEQFSKMFGV